MGALRAPARPRCTSFFAQAVGGDTLRMVWQDGDMTTFLDQFRADLRRATQDHQRDLVVAVLKRRAGDLTFGHLRKLLASQLGKDLDDVTLASLFGGNVNTAKPPVADKAAKSPARRKVAKSKVTTKAKPKPKTKPKTKRVSQQTIDAVTQALTAAGRTLKTAEIVAKTGLHRKTVLKALKQLTKDGVIEASDPADSATMAKAEKPAERPALSDDERLDAAVVAAMKAARGDVASSAIQKATGASLAKIRASLGRLVKKGHAYRSGERRFTRYGLNVLAEPRRD